MKRAWAILAVCSVGFLLSMFYRVSPTIIAPQLTRDLGLTPMELSDLSAAFFYAFASCQIPLGLVLDRIGIRGPMTILALVGSTGALIFSMSSGPDSALWARAMMGLGMSCNLMGPLTLLARWFPPNRFATVAGLLTAVGSGGYVLAATPLAWMTVAWGWRGAFVFIAALNFLQAVAMFFIVRDWPEGADRPVHKTGNPLAGLARIVKMPAYWGMSLCAFTRFGSGMALQGLWAGPFLMGGLGFSAMEAGNALLMVSLGTMLGLPLFGRLSDHVLKSRKKVGLPATFIYAGLLLAMVWFPRGMEPVWVLSFFAVLGLINAPSQILYAHMKELAPVQYTATAMTGVNLFTMLGPAALMQITGMVAPQGDPLSAAPGEYAMIWYVLGGAVLLAGVVYCFVPDSRILKQGGQE